MKRLTKKQIILILTVSITLLVPFAIASYFVLSSNINFWYDPARDFLLALGNKHKLTLIGPTSGIPGIFYGPYWIWLLSFGMLFSLDPRIVIFLVVTIPYFTLFPFILFQFRKLFGWTTCILLWLLFIFGVGIDYAINPWNPHPAPLLFLLLVYLLTFIDVKEKGKRRLINMSVIGFIAGLLINFHISFGLGVLAGTVLYLLIIFVKMKSTITERISFFVLFMIGVFVTFLPFVIFESRHGFHQIQTALHVFSAKGAVVGVKGLTKGMIIQTFFGTLGQVLKISQPYVWVAFGVGIGYFLSQVMRKQIRLSAKEYRLLLLLLCVTSGILFLYLTSKNPVWEYHFIGVEIIFLLLLGVIINKSIFLKALFGIITIFIVIVYLTKFIGNIHSNPLLSTSLGTEEHIVRLITHDAKNQDYTVFAYSPSIYIYEYAYLFAWIGNKDVPYDPGMTKKTANTVYLIIPKSVKSEVDFIHSHTPDTKYQTVKE